MLTEIKCPTCQAPMQQLFGANHAGCFECGAVKRDAFMPQYTRDNPDEFSNHYRATIRAGMRVLHWSSYDYDHLNARIDAAGYRPFVTCWTVEGVK